MTEYFLFTIDHSSPKAAFDSYNDSMRRYNKWCENMDKLSEKKEGEVYTVFIDNDGNKTIL